MFCGSLSDHAKLWDGPAKGSTMSLSFKQVAAALS